MLILSCSACASQQNRTPDRQLPTKQLSNTFSFPGLPFHWYTQEEFSALARSKPATPERCFPKDFKPSSVETTKLYDNTIHFIQHNGKKLGVEIENITELDGLPTAPFSFSVFTIENCHTASLLVLKNGKWHAYYTNIIFGQNNLRYGWSYNTQRKELLLNNIIQENGAWMQKARLIDLPSKVSTELPLDLCTVTSSILNDGSIIGGYMEAKADAPSVYCSFTKEGKLLYKFYPLNVQGTSVGGARLFDNGRFMLAIDYNSHILRANGVVSRSEPEQHRVIIMDMIGKDRWATYRYPKNVGPGGYFALETSDWDSEYDFSQFTWNDRKPKLRFRHKIFADGESPPSNNWHLGPWYDLVFDTMYD